MTGNRQGPRQTYVYQSDVPSVRYTYVTDADLAVAGLGAAGAAPEVFDPAMPGTPVPTPAPRGFNFRTVFAQSPTDGARKELIAANPTANLYATTIRLSVPEIDGDSTFVTTGRKGETLSF